MPKPKDLTQQLADHIKRNLTKGYTPDALRFSLINQGYSRITVEKAIEKANQQLAKIAPIMKEVPQISYKIESEVQSAPLPTSLWQKIKNWFK